MSMRKKPRKTFAVQILLTYKGRYWNERVYENIEAADVAAARKVALEAGAQYIAEVCDRAGHDPDDYAVQAGYIEENTDGNPIQRYLHGHGFEDMDDGDWPDTGTNVVLRGAGLPPPVIPPVTKPFSCPVHDLCAVTVVLGASTLSTELTEVNIK